MVLVDDSFFVFDGIGGSSFGGGEVLHPDVWVVVGEVGIGWEVWEDFAVVGG